jgi:hypothetical protein
MGKSRLRHFFETLSHCRPQQAWFLRPAQQHNPQLREDASDE